MSNEIIDRLATAIRLSFGSVARPALDQITDHECPECNHLRTIFGETNWFELSAEELESNFENLPLFTPRAYRHFLPAFLLRALDASRPHPTAWAASSNVPLFTVMSLQKRVAFGENDEGARFSIEQRRVIREFLEIARASDVDLRDEADHALLVWR